MLGMILAGKGELRRQETVGAGADEPVGTTTTMTMTATTTTTTTTSKGAFARWIKKVLSL
ncbi:hypothetical protein DENSPDRAFT_843789 [Dentipellis sp. KUC8613]|nr:hypothetical protein DENSPDRAFT_843789 [Dentipellis sp. KUC8613]